MCRWPAVKGAACLQNIARNPQNKCANECGFHRVLTGRTAVMLDEYERMLTGFSSGANGLHLDGNVFSDGESRYTAWRHGVTYVFPTQEKV